jgi:hypothetical protein
VYKCYLKAGRAWLTLPFIIASAIAMQCIRFASIADESAHVIAASQITNTYTLVWWQENSFNREYSFYIALYAGLGISQALWTFFL